MKTKIIFLLCLCLTLPACASSGGASPDTHIERDTLIPERKNIYKNNQYEGYIKRDPLIKDWFNVYDKEGKKQGTWKRDNLFKDRWYFEKSGELEN